MDYFRAQQNTRLKHLSVNRYDLQYDKPTGALDCRVSCYSLTASRPWTTSEPSRTSASNTSLPIGMAFNVTSQQEHLTVECHVTA